jgi:hypothetical protein
MRRRQPPDAAVPPNRPAGPRNLVQRADLVRFSSDTRLQLPGRRHAAWHAEIRLASRSSATFAAAGTSCLPTMNSESARAAATAARAADLQSAEPSGETK